MNERTFLRYIRASSVAGTLVAAFWQAFDSTEWVAWSSGCLNSVSLLFDSIAKDDFIVADPTTHRSRLTGTTELEHRLERDASADVSQERTQGHDESGQGAAVDSEIHSLSELLDRMEALSKQGDEVAFGEVMDAVGEKSFVPLLMLAGLVMAAPVIGDIPGVPVLMGLLVLLASVQFLLNREHVWIPKWLERRQVSSSKVQKTLSWLRKPSRWIDRVSKTRLTTFVDHAGAVLSALICIVIAMATPVMEVVPMSANVAGIAIIAFGIALLARDGVIAIGAILLSVGTGIWIGWQLLQ